MHGLKKKTHMSRGMYLIYAVLILYCLFNLLSFLWLFSSSLKGKTEIFSSSPWALPERAVWSNYADAWKIGNIGRYMLNSLYVTGVTTVVTLILASMASYILGRIKFKASGLVMACFMVAMMLPPFMIAVPLFDLLSQINLLNSLNGLILVYITKQLPLNIFVLASFYKGLPPDLEEAAAIDGASPSMTFARVMMPLTSSAMISCGIINVLNVWNEFLFGLIFLSDKKVYTLPIGIFYLNQAADYSSSWSILFAGMIMSVIPVLIIFALFQNQFATGVSQGAVKI